MRSILWPIGVLLAFLPVAASAQESIRDLKGTGQFGAFLTPGQVDRWVFDGEKGETIIAHVSSREFDPLLGLAKKGGLDDVIVLPDIDDPGTQSRFMFRLPEKGQFKIRVLAYKNQGGGNYKLSVRRFQATPIEVGKAVLATFDSDGKGYHFFKASKDQILVPQLKGTSSSAWSLLDFKGRDVDRWAGSSLMDDAGESCIVVSGQAGFRYDLVLREARRKDLTSVKNPNSSLQQGEMDVWNIQGKPGDFRVFEVEKSGSLHSRVLYAPMDKESESRIKRPGDRPELQLLRIGNRGNHLRYAAILGRAGRYQLQLFAETASTYKLKASDPSVPIKTGTDIDASLPVGGATFYTFNAAPGQLLQAKLESQKFVPLLRLYDPRGTLIEASDDGADARITHMAVSAGLYRLQVSSLGDGGGGEFRQALTETKLKELTIGGRGKGAIQPGATDFWAFAGKEGQTVFLNVRSAAFEPLVSLRSPNGVQLIANQRGNPDTGSLVALKLPKTGRYTVWVSSARGAGDYNVRLIDGD